MPLQSGGSSSSRASSRDNDEENDRLSRSSSGSSLGPTPERICMSRRPSLYSRGSARTSTKSSRDPSRSPVPLPSVAKSRTLSLTTFAKRRSSLGTPKESKGDAMRRWSSSNAPSYEEKQRVAPLPTQEQCRLGVEWTAKLQSTEEIRQRLKECCRQCLTYVDASLPLLSQNSAQERVRLGENISKEVCTFTQTLAQAAYKTVSTELEELDRIRRECLEVEDKVAKMNETYLKEITNSRDKVRQSNAVAGNAIKVVESVEFYDPMNYLSPQAKQTAMCVLDEKLKAIFSYDPSLRAQVNVIELERAQNAVLSTKLVTAQTECGQLKEENRTLTGRVKKMDMDRDKLLFESGSSRAEAQALRRRIEELETAKPHRHCGVQVGEPPPQVRSFGAQAEVACASIGIEALPDEICPKRTSEMEVQTDTPDSPELLQSREQACKASAQARAFKARAQNLAGSVGDLEAQVHELEMQAEQSAERERDLLDRLKSSESRLCELESQLDEANATPPTWRRLANTEIEARPTGEPEEHEKLQEELRSATQEVELLSGAQEALRREVQEAREAASKANRARLEMLNATGSEVSSQLVGALEAAESEKRRLSKDVDNLNAALSMAMSRISAFELLVASRGGPEEAYPTTTPGRVRAEYKELTALKDQQAASREKVQIQKAQLDEVLRENQVLHLALREMQHDMLGITKQLRAAMPAAEVMSPDLESVVGRMQKVVDQGGGAYVRLHKEQQLREIAKGARRNSHSAVDSPEGALRNSLSAVGSPEGSRRNIRSNVASAEGSRRNSPSAGGFAEGSRRNGHSAAGAAEGQEDREVDGGGVNATPARSRHTSREPSITNVAFGTDSAQSGCTNQGITGGTCITPHGGAGGAAAAAALAASHVARRMSEERERLRLQSIVPPTRHTPPPLDPLVSPAKKPWKTLPPVTLKTPRYDCAAFKSDPPPADYDTAASGDAAGAVGATTGGGNGGGTALVDGKVVLKGRMLLERGHGTMKQFVTDNLEPRGNLVFSSRGLAKVDGKQATRRMS